MAGRWNLYSSRAVITGATKGIGRAIAHEFVKLGAEVFITSRNEDDIENVVGELKYFSEAHGMKADVTKPEDRLALAARIEELWGGRVDVLVNNAGTNIRKRTTEYTSEEYQYLIDTNLTSAFELCRLFYPMLKNSKYASILNIGSIAGQTVVKTGLPYAAAKAGMAHLSRYLAVEWGPDKIRVNSIEPWYIETPLTAVVLDNEKSSAKIIERTPMGRWGQPQEIAGLAAFLSMRSASYISGQNIAVDGAASKFIF